MLTIRRLVWEEANIAHIAIHDVVPEEVEQLCHGPFIVGASFINESFQGAWNGNAQTGAGNTLGLEHDIGVSAGASYDWAPGATLYVDYLWGTRHQANHDFFANTTGKSNNNTRAQGLVIGQNFRW